MLISPTNRNEINLINCNRTLQFQISAHVLVVTLLLSDI